MGRMTTARRLDDHYLARLPDGTVKQINPFTGTQVWTVPGTRPASPSPCANRLWMRHCGYDDARLSGGGADAGIDVRTTGALAQVKLEGCHHWPSSPPTGSHMRDVYRRSMTSNGLLIAGIVAVVVGLTSLGGNRAVGVLLLLAGIALLIASVRVRGVRRGSGR